MKGDRVFLYCLRLLAGISLLIMCAFFIQVFWDAWPALKTMGFRFLTTNDWDPNQQHFGAAAFIYGTLVSSLLALVIAIPVSVSTALCLTEVFPSRVATTIGFLVEMLAAIPSVVFGLWGVFVLAPILRNVVQPALTTTVGWIPLFSGPPLGVGMLAAGVILAIMITPSLTALAREVFLSIPRIQREAALALGATHWEMIQVAVLKSARGGLWSAVILALGRALGETMAVTMVIGNRPQIAASLFAPAQSLAAILANEYAEATDELHLSALAALGLTLLVLSTLIHLGSKFIIRRKSIS